VWIFVQLPKGIKDVLRNTTGDSNAPMAIHISILLYCSREWRWYINYLSDIVSKMVSLDG
jgi:hypothetical protein